MAALVHPLKDTASLTIPATLLVLALGAIALQSLPMPWSAPAVAPETVTLPPGEVTYRASGQFFVDGNPVDAPLAEVVIPAPLTMMKHQVSAADYALCVAEGACAPAEPENQGEGNIPVTGVNYGDATAYAAWLSHRTGQHWTLPTDAQWAYAAGSRFTDDALNIDDATNPALRWLADYRKEAERQAVADPIPKPLGAYGENEFGLVDMGGNVWEWTDTCNSRVHVDAAGTILSEQPACTIRVLEGKHRAAMSYFIRDAKSGGCSVGLPPDNLGFRLVRQPAWHENLWAQLGL
jgi:formylglycine-generating enzyme required for sulfatase activity